MVAIGKQAREAAEAGEFDELPSAAQLRLAMEWSKSRGGANWDALDQEEIDKRIAESLGDDPREYDADDVPPFDEDGD